MSYFKKFFGHLKTVLTHKRWVFYYASRLGYAWRGLVHDLSKFSPVEFFESVKYWDGKRSPILSAKENDGISYAWLHHRGRNKHHYEYWVDKLDQGGVPYRMPFKYVVEMVCDWLAACRTYTKDPNKVFQREYNWWVSHSSGVKIHEDSKKLVTKILWNLTEHEQYRGDEKMALKDIHRAIGFWEELYNDLGHNWYNWWDKYYE